MKLKLTIIAVVCIVVAPALVMAEATTNTVYGDFRYSINWVDQEDDGLSGENNNSRLGFKGSVGDDNLKAIYHLQAGADNDPEDPAEDEVFTHRFFFAGVKSDMVGTVRYGRIATPYKTPGRKLDPFYDTSAGTSFGGANYGLSGLTDGWTNNSLIWNSPNWGGITIDSAIFIDDSKEDNHDYNLGFSWSGEGLTAGVQWLALDSSGVVTNSPGDSDAIRGHVSYDTEQFGVGLSYEFIDVDGADDDPQYLYLAGTFNATDNITLGASYGNVNDTALSDGNGYTLAVFCDALENTQFYLLWSLVDFDDVDERNTVALGASHKFSFDIIS